MKLSDVLLQSYKISEYCDDELNKCYCKYSNNIIVDYKTFQYCESCAPLWYVISNSPMYKWTKFEMEE